MAYINKNDFSIVTTVGPLTKEDYFECDDLIAPAISLLNKKGYETNYCCSGHPYLNVSRQFLREYPSEEELNKYNIITIGSTSDGTFYKLNTKEFPYYMIRYSKSCAGRLYVLFKKRYKFPNIPEDMHIKDTYTQCGLFFGIYLNKDKNPALPEDDYFTRMNKIQEINKIFYEWVEKLPSLI